MNVETIMELTRVYGLVFIIVVGCLNLIIYSQIE